MVKLYTVIFVVLLALTSAAGFFYLNDKITAGERAIAEGERQIQEGQRALKAGKAKLQAGRQKLSQGKQKYHAVKAIPFGALAQAVPETTVIAVIANKKIEEGGKQIAAGEKQVAAGAQKIKAGEKRLKEGKLALAQGKQKLEMAKQWRFAFGAGMIFFTILTILLMLFWRRRTQ